MIKRGFGLEFFNKRKKPPEKEQRNRVVFYTTRPEIVKSQPKKLQKIAWKPKFTPRPLKVVATPLIKVAIAVVLVLLTYAALGSRLLVLNKIEITGTHLTTPEQIEKAVFKKGFKSTNAILFNDGKATRQILTIPQVNKVRFRKNIWRRVLIVEIKEHENTIIWQTNNERFMVNRFGMVYDIAKEDSPLPVVEDLKNVPVNINQKIVTTEFIEFITATVANLPRKTNLSVSKILLPETTFEIDIVTNEGWKIIMDTTRSVETQLNNLVKTLKTIGKPQSYVDLRVEDRVYYK